MNTKLIEDVANAVLYEGYALYPYRASSVKNRQRWNFGVLYPAAFVAGQPGNDRSSMQTECLARIKANPARVNVRLRFLQLLERTNEDAPSQMWQEGIERDVYVPAAGIGGLLSRAIARSFVFDAAAEREGSMVRRRELIEGRIVIEAEDLGKSVVKLRVRVENVAVIDKGADLTRDSALLHSLVSAHTILGIEGGDFISLLEPPADFGALAAECKNEGTWPVLAGEDGACDAILSSPIILYDYPKIAPESAGSLFDGTEIDEILTLRIMTLTDQEKAEMAQDERTRQILERTESLAPEQLLEMHGAWRSVSGTKDKAL